MKRFRPRFAKHLSSECGIGMYDVALQAGGLATQHDPLTTRIH